MPSPLSLSLHAGLCAAGFAVICINTALAEQAEQVRVLMNNATGTNARQLAALLAQSRSSNAAVSSQ